MLAIILILLAIDQISKVVVRRWLDPHELIQLLPFFRLEHVQNRGIAFGMLDTHSNIILLVSFVIVATIAVAAFLVRNNKRLIWPLAFLVAGSVGNFIDRIVNGSVTDFLHVEYWPAFNFADSLIVIGVILLVMRLLLWPDLQQLGEKKGREGHENQRA